MQLLKGWGVDLNVVLWKDDKYRLNLDITVDLDADKWNKSKVQSSVCRTIIFVYKDLYIRMPECVLERQTRTW